MSSFSSKIAALILKPKLKKMKQLLAYEEYGGAGLFGIAAPVIKAHGSSNAYAFSRALAQAEMMVEQHVVAKIIEAKTK